MIYHYYYHYYLFLCPATTVTATTTIRVPSTMEEEITIDAGSILFPFIKKQEKKKSKNECGFQLIEFAAQVLMSRPMSRSISID